jgi:hypothetical protein
VHGCRTKRLSQQFGIGYDLSCLLDDMAEEAILCGGEVNVRAPNGYALLHHIHSQITNLEDGGHDPSVPVRMPKCGSQTREQLAD